MPVERKEVFLPVPEDPIKFFFESKRIKLTIPIIQDTIPIIDENVEMIEIKQGPYLGADDKILF